MCQPEVQVAILGPATEMTEHIPEWFDANITPAAVGVRITGTCADCGAKLEGKIFQELMEVLKVHYDVAHVDTRS